MARGANFKIGRSSDRHNFRDFDDKFIQPQTHLAITNPDHQCKDMITILGKRAGDLSAENCRGFQKKIQRQLKNEYINSCKKDGRKRAGNAKLVLEAVINLEEHHTKEDLKKLRDRLEKDLNIEMLYLVAHFDEGHQDKNGEIKINAHAHFKFTTLVDGKVTERNKAWVRKAQDICAEVLEMKRGEAVEISGKKGMGHKAYRQSKKNEKKLTTELDEVKQDVCNFAGVSDFQRARKIMKESGRATAADYSELKRWRSLNKTPEEIEQFLEKFKTDQAEPKLEKIPTEKIIEELNKRPLTPEHQNSLLALANKKFKKFFTDIVSFLEDKFGDDKHMAYDSDMQARFKREFEKQKSGGQEAPQEPQRGDNGTKPTVRPKKRR